MKSHNQFRAICADIKNLKQRIRRIRLIRKMNHVDSCRKTPDCTPNLRTRESIAKMKFIALPHRSLRSRFSTPQLPFLRLPEECTPRTPFCQRGQAKHSVHKGLRHISRELYAIGRQLLTQKWKNYVGNEGDFVGK